MSPDTQDHVTKFWSLIDETLNAVLFLLIGFEVHPSSVGLAADGARRGGDPAHHSGPRASSVGMPMLVPPGPLSRLPSGALHDPGSWRSERRHFYRPRPLGPAISPFKEVIVIATSHVVVLFSVLIQAPVVGIAARRLFGGQQTH